MNGKGSRPRPYSISGEEFANSWERIFGKKGEGASKPEQPAATGSEEQSK